MTAKKHRWPKMLNPHERTHARDFPDQKCLDCGLERTRISSGSNGHWEYWQAQTRPFQLPDGSWERRLYYLHGRLQREMRPFAGECKPQPPMRLPEATTSFTSQEPTP